MFCRAVFAQFRKQFLRVGLSIVRAERSRTLEAVLNREVDFGVVAMPVKDPRLTVELIHKDELAFVVPIQSCPRCLSDCKPEGSRPTSACADEARSPA